MTPRAMRFHITSLRFRATGFFTCEKSAVRIALAAASAQAATRYWDGGSVDIVANGDGNSDGISGT